MGESQHRVTPKNTVRYRQVRGCQLPGKDLLASEKLPELVQQEEQTF